MSPNSVISQPEIAVHTLPDGTRQVSVSIMVPAATDIASLLDFEAQAQSATNAIGLKVMELGFAAFDTEGEPILLGKVRMTSKGRSPENYRSLFGSQSIERHVYQSSQGGKIYVPMEVGGRILCHCSPRLLSCVSARYTEVPAEKVQMGFAESNQITISTSLVQEVARAVGGVALAKEPYWTYLPTNISPSDIAAIGLSIDGALVPLLHEVKWREAMVGTITLYDDEREVLHTAYFAKAPQAGKEKFIEQMAHEVEAYKAWCPDALWVGISDGAEHLRTLLTPHCQQLVLDFYHVAEYVSGASGAMMEVDTPEGRKTWTKHELHELKHTPGAAEKLRQRLQTRLDQYEGTKAASSELVKLLAAAVSYLTNNIDRMDYADCLKEGLPIGSGKVESACKTLVKLRFCCAGSRWHGESVDALLTVKALRESDGRWAEFWKRIDRRGY